MELERPASELARMESLSEEESRKKKKQSWVTKWKLIIFNIEDVRKKAGGWRTMAFIIGNEFCEKLATIGLFFNLILYLVQVYHIEQVAAANILNIVSGSNSMMPLLGGFIADTYLGRFLTLLIGCVFNLMGMLFLLFSAVVPSLQPASCSSPEPQQCQQANAGQLSVIFMGFFCIVIASGGIRPCNYTFGADQFSQKTVEQRKDFQSYTNYYFVSIYVAVLIAGTLIVYVQQDVDWGWGFAIPSFLMLFSLFFYIIGMKRYRYVPPMGSPLKALAKVAISAYHKRRLPLPPTTDLLFNPPLLTANQDSQPAAQLPHTKQFRFLDKAAIAVPGDVDDDAAILRPWRVCPISEVEKLKCILRIVPIWIANMFYAMALSQQNSFVVLQANTMDRQVVSKFKIPAGSVGVFAMLTLIAWLPFYDRIVLPVARRITGTERGISFLKRIGAGYLLASLTMLMGGLVEARRKSVARSNGLDLHPDRGPVPYSVFWLVPQTCLMGLAESFSAIGHTEFYYDQIPESMRSTAGSFGSVVSGIGAYVNSALLMSVHEITRRKGDDWLADNLNVAHLDYYYYLIASILGANFLYFLIISRWYTYNSATQSTPNKEEDQIQQL